MKRQFTINKRLPVGDLLMIAVTLALFGCATHAGNPPAAVNGQWTQLNGIQGTVSQMLISSNGTPLASANGTVPGTTGGVFAWDGQQFQPIDNLQGLTNLAVRSIADIQGIIFAGTGAGPTGGVFQCCTEQNPDWTQANNNLTRPIGPNPPSVLAFAATPGFVFAGTSRGGIFRSQNSPIFWNNTLPERTVFAFFVDGSGSFLLAGTDQGSFRSTDGGMTWGASTTLSSQVAAFAANGSNSPFGNAILAGTDGGLFCSLDSGMTWTLCDNLPFPARQPVTALLVVSSNNINYIFAGTNNGLFRSTDNGQTWQACAALPNPTVTSMTSLDNNLYVGTSGGVFQGTGFIGN